MEHRIEILVEPEHKVKIEKDELLKIHVCVFPSPLTLTHVGTHVLLKKCRKKIEGDEKISDYFLKLNYCL